MPEGTIEHGMLGVLAFKKSVFAGVLDGGEDRVSLGGTRLRKFMDHVGQVTDAVPATAHEPPPAPEPEPEEAPVAEREAAGPTAPPAIAPSPLQPLIETGAAFLREIVRTAAESRAQGRSPIDAFVQTDEGTGQPYLKIPVPDRQTVETAASALASLLNAFMGGSDAARR